MDNKLATKYGLDTLEEHIKYFDGEEKEAKLVYYNIFLEKTDYICNKIIEGVSTWEEYKEEKEARQYCREQIRRLNG